MGSAESGLQLLLTDQPAEADALAEKLELRNGQRRTLDGQVYAEVEAELALEFPDIEDTSERLADF